MKRFWRMTLLAFFVISVMVIGSAEELEVRIEGVDLPGDAVTAEQMQNIEELVTNGIQLPEPEAEDVPTAGVSVNESAPEDFQIENGVLVSYVGSGGDVVIPDGVAAIGVEAFWYCSSLKTVAIPDTVTSIGDRAFQGCNNLESVVIGNGVVTIGELAFAGCNLGNVDFGNRVASIGECAFWYNPLTELNLPDSVTSIGDQAFQSLDELTSLTLHGSITNMGEAAFYNCDKLTSLIVRDGNTTIGELAFKECHTLTSVTFEGNAGKIQEYSFSFCENLKSFTFPKNIDRIDAGVFYSCTGFLDITIPSGVTSIGDTAFCGCTGLTYFDVPSGVTSIGSAAFRYCESMTGITIPASVTSIADDAFEGIKSNVTIYCKSGSYAEKYAKDHYMQYVADGQGEGGESEEGPKKVALSKNKATVVVGGKLTLKAKLTPAGAKTTLTWFSSNEEVATVTDKGVVKAVKKGTATITVKTANGKKATCKITVPDAPTKITFAKKAYTVKVGKKVKLSVKLTPAKAKTKLTFSSSNKKIATVTSKGVVKGVKKGTATITVKTANGLKKTVKVKVE